VLPAGVASTIFTEKQEHASTTTVQERCVGRKNKNGAPKQHMTPGTCDLKNHMKRWRQVVIISENCNP
jgi:hypothetical protein